MIVLAALAKADLIGRGTVLGKPATAGSKQAFVNPKTGKAIVKDSSGAEGKLWRAAVQEAVMKEIPADKLIDAPLALEVTFVRPRPASHYGTGRNAGVLKPSAPEYPATRPDATKLLRAFEDALVGVVIRDDARIVTIVVHKRWGEPERAEWALWRLPDSVPGDNRATLPGQQSLVSEGDQVEEAEAADRVDRADDRHRPTLFPGL